MVQRYNLWKLCLKDTLELKLRDEQSWQGEGYGLRHAGHTAQRPSGGGSTMPSGMEQKPAGLRQRG